MTSDKTCDELLAALAEALPEELLDTDALLRDLGRAKPGKRAEVLFDLLLEAGLFCSTEWYRFSESDFSKLPTRKDFDLSGFNDYCASVHGMALDGEYVEPWDCAFIEVLNGLLIKQETGLQLAEWHTGSSGDTSDFLCLKVGCDTPAFKTLAETLLPLGIKLEPVPPRSAADALQEFRAAGAIFSELEETETAPETEDDSDLPIVKVDALNWAIAPIYSDARPFAPNGLAAVSQKSGRLEKWGFINAKGETVISFEYDEADSFYAANRGLAAVKIGKKWGFINEAGEIVIAPKYADVQKNFSENGLTRVQPLKSKVCYGYINRQGELVITARYSTAKAFTADGLAKVQNYDDGLWGMIDAKGEFVVPARYGEIPHDQFCAHGLLGVCGMECDTGYVNRRGEEVIPLQYTIFEPSVFAENGLVARLKYPNDEGYVGKWGYLDTRGNLVIPYQFDEALDFAKNGLAAVQWKGKDGFINAKGEWVIPPRFAATRGFSENGLAATQEQEDGPSGYIDSQGEWVIPPSFDVALWFDQRGLTVVGRGGKKGVINAHGEIVVPLRFDEVEFINSGFISWFSSPYIDSVSFAQLGIETAPFIKVSHHRSRTEGLYRTTGEVVIQLGAFYIDEGFASNGLLRAQATYEGKWGFLRAEGTAR